MSDPVTRLDANNQTQSAVDSLLKDLAPLMDPNTTSAQKHAAEGTISRDIAKLPASLQQTARNVYYNPQPGMSGEQALVSFLQQNLSNETLYSLSHANKGLASQYSPQVMQGAMTSFGGQGGTVTQQSVNAIRGTLAAMGMSDAQSMDLLYRMQAKQLTPTQQQDLVARLNRGEGLSAIASYYPDQMASFIADNPSVQSSMAMYLSRPENEALAQQMMPYMSAAVSQQTGMGAQNPIASFLNGAKDMLGMPAHAAMGLMTNATHFFNEFLDPTPEYTNTSSLGEQAYNRLLSGTRLKYTGRLREIQTQAGAQNLMKAFGDIGLTEGGAQWLASIMNSRSAEMGISAMKPQLIAGLSQFTGEEAAASIVNGLEQNFKGLFGGFQGDYGAVLNTATAGTHDRRAIEQYGLMATHLALIQPTLENRFMRADNYRSALTSMTRDGYNLNYLVTHHDQDMYRQAAKMSTAQREQMRSDLITSEKEWSNKKWADMTQAERDTAISNIQKSKLSWNRSQYFAEDGTLKEGVTAQDAYGAFENARIENNADYVMGALEGTPEEIQNNIGKLNGSGVNRMKKDIRNQVGAAVLEDIVGARANIENNFHNVRLGVRDDTGFLAKFQGEDQLIRLFGGADVTGDYGTQAARAGSTLIMGDMAGMTAERTASLVSETGKIAQQFGLKGDAVQVAGNLATSMVMTAQLQPHTGPIDPNRLQMFASRNAGSIVASQNSRNLVFLMNERFAEGSKMQKLKEKLLRGEQLDENELKEITVDSLRRDYTGSAANFASHMSDAVYQQRFSSMTEEQQIAYNLNATKAEQNRFRDLLNTDAYKGVWKSAITESSYNGDVAQLYTVRNKLLGEIEPDRVAKILSGEEEPTEEERKKIEALGLTDQIESIRRNVLNQEDFQKDFRAADASLAHLKNPDATINDVDVSMRGSTREQAIIAARTQSLKKQLPVDFGQTLMESLAETEGDVGTRFGKWVKNYMQGGKHTAEDARKVLEQNGLQYMLHSASAKSADFSRIVDNLNIEDTEIEELLEKMGVEPREGESKEEALGSALHSATQKELEDYAAKFKETAAGKRILRQIGVAVDKAAEEVSKGSNPAKPQDSVKEGDSTNVQSDGSKAATSPDAPAAAQPVQQIPIRQTGGGDAVAVVLVNPPDQPKATVPEKQKG